MQYTHPSLSTFDLKTPLGRALAKAPRARNKSRVATAGVKIDTFGWDTVSALTLPYVNSAIAMQKSSPPGFSEESPGVYAVQGDFEDWSVVRGGDGADLHMALPIDNVSGWFMASGKETFGYGKANVIIEVKLQDLPQPAEQPRSAGVKKRLVARTSGGTPTDPVAALITVEWLDGEPDPGMARYVIEAGITAWANSHLDAFTHVFATINLDRVIDKGQWAFCNPTYTTYAYADGPTVEQSVLGILCMTNSRSPGKATNVVDRRAVPGGKQGGFLLSANRFLADLVLPSLKVNWSNAVPGDFTVSDYEIKLNDDTSFYLPAVHHAGSEYTPKLTQFSLTINNSQIEVAAYTTTHISPGIDVWCQTYHTYSIGLGENKKSEQTLVYNTVGSPTELHGNHIAEWVKVTEIVLGIIAAVVIVVLGVLTDGAAFVVAAIIAGLLFGVAAATPEIIAAVQEGTSPSIDLLAFNIADPIVWTGGKQFVLSSADLNGCLQLGGSLGFPADAG